MKWGRERGAAAAPAYFGTRRVDEKHSYDPARTFQESKEDVSDAASPQKRRGCECNDVQEGRAITTREAN